MIDSKTAMGLTQNTEDSLRRRAASMFQFGKTACDRAKTTEARQRGCNDVKWLKIVMAVYGVLDIHK